MMLPDSLLQFGVHRQCFYNKKDTTSNSLNSPEERILEGEGLLLYVLGVGGRHGSTVGGVMLPRRDKYSYLVDIVFFCVLTITEIK